MINLLKKSFFLTYLRPTIEYGSALWAPFCKSGIDDLHLLQDKALILCHNNIVFESLEDRRVCSDLITWYFSFYITSRIWTQLIVSM